MNNRFLRALDLQFRLLLRLVGPATPFVLAILIAGVHLQEPKFFRLQGLDLAWPFVFGIADLISGCAVLLAVAGRRTLIRVKLARAASAIAFGTTGLAVAVVVGAAIDSFLGASTPWDHIPALLARHTMVWMPIAVLAQSTLFVGSVLGRLVAVAAAFAVLTWVMPLSSPFALADKILPSALALAGAFVTIIESDQ